MSQNGETEQITDHNINITQRQCIELSGVEDIVSFDEHEVILRTSMGMMSVDGEKLHIIKMSVETGNISIEGSLNGLFYIDGGKQKQSLFGKKKDR